LPAPPLAVAAGNASFAVSVPAYDVKALRVTM
jgi:hypothetical protein